MPDNLPYDEKELLKRIAEGDEAAFAVLFRTYVPKLENFVKSITKNDSLVDEVIQESFVRLWLNREKLAEIDSLKTWIFRVVSYVCFYYLRKQALQRKAIDKFSNDNEEQNSTEEFMGLRDLEKIIQKAISRLTPSQRRVYKLSREGGYKIPEIAMQLDISPNTVKNILVASLRSIREYAASQGFTLSFLLLWLLF